MKHMHDNEPPEDRRDADPIDEPIDKPIDNPDVGDDQDPERQLSSINNLQGGGNGDHGLQIGEGIPPESAARQEEDGPPDESEGNAVRSTSLRDDV